jgi:hypothetical protein
MAVRSGGIIEVPAAGKQRLRGAGIAFAVSCSFHCLKRGSGILVQRNPLLFIMKKALLK